MNKTRSQTERTPASVQEFYDSFADERFVRDYIYGNRRVARQLRFFASAIPESAKRILVIGCGSGESADFVARRVTRQGKILGIDISPRAIQLAQKLFPHDRIEYRVMNILEEGLEGQWDVILLPDVYEHVPLTSRPDFHRKLNAMIAKEGRVLVTVPSPGHQEYAHREGGDVQIIDDIVELHDLIRLADDLSGTLTYFSLISIWNTNDYMHAGIERRPLVMKPLAKVTPVGIADREQLSNLCCVFRFVQKFSGWSMVARYFRIRRVKRALNIRSHLWRE
jgi:SAM-dependent methyltransferase